MRKGSRSSYRTEETWGDRTSGEMDPLNGPLCTQMRERWTESEERKTESGKKEPIAMGDR